MAHYPSSCESKKNLTWDAENSRTTSNKTHLDDFHSENKSSKNDFEDSGQNMFLFDESSDSVECDNEVTVIAAYPKTDTIHSLNDQQDSFKNHQRDLMFGIPFSSSQESSFKGLGSTTFGKLHNYTDRMEKYPQTENLSYSESNEKPEQPELKKSPAKLLFQTFIEEDSCNAVDIQISKDAGNSSSRTHRQTVESLNSDDNDSNPSSKLSFKGKIKSLNQTHLITQKKYLGQTEVSQSLSNNNILQEFSESFTLKKYSNDKSPDLFAEAEGKSDDKLDDHEDKEAQEVKQYKKNLGGVLPMPSATIPQLVLVGAMLSKKEDNLNFINDIKDERSKQIVPTEDSSNFSISSSLFKPTHSLEETKNTQRKDMSSVRQHGLCCNLNRASENNEYLSLAVTERFIGAETASLYTNSPSSAKKRSTRLKLLSQSPGNRLSHLAKRRSIFSYASLAAQKTSTLLEPQIMLDEKKTKNRRKITSNHIGKSYRALLFTPEKQQRNKDHKLISSTPYFTPGTAKQLDMLPKRKRNHCDDNDDADTSEVISQRSKLLKTGKSSVPTSRSLERKSQSFFIGSGPSTSSSANSQQRLPRTSSGSYSDCPAPVNSLTENQKKKLLWAVSQALQERKITTKHESFKQYASILVQVVRRIFLEFYQNSSTSNSETMLRLTKKYVCSVITGSTPDDIYLQAKKHIENTKRQSTTRLSGYIGPEEYQQLRKQSSQSLYSQSQSLTGSSQNICSVGSSLNSFGLLSQTSSGFCSSTNDMTMSQTSFLGQMSQGLLHTDTTQNSNSRSDTKTLQTCSELQKSSSKSNLFGVVLRENVDCDVRKSAQNNFTAEDQRNVNRTSTTIDRRYCTKARRQISFDI